MLNSMPVFPAMLKYFKSKTYNFTTAQEIYLENIMGVREMKSVNTCLF